jgi:hypothetical protein
MRGTRTAAQPAAEADGAVALFGVLIVQEQRTGAAAEADR